MPDLAGRTVTDHATDIQCGHIIANTEDKIRVMLDEQHAEIAKAIIARDPAAARAAANIHLSFVQASLREAAGKAGRRAGNGAAAPDAAPVRRRKRADNASGA